MRIFFPGFDLYHDKIGLFLSAHGWGRPKRPSLPKICHTYPTIIKLGSYTLPKGNLGNI